MADDDASYSSGSSYASSSEEEEDFAPPPPPPPPPADGDDHYDHDEERGSDPPAETETATVETAPPQTNPNPPEKYNSNSAAAVAATTLASPPQSLYHHTAAGYQDPDEVAEELEITKTPTLRRLDREEKKARRKAYCQRNRCRILWTAAVLLVLVALAVALGIVFGTADKDANKSPNIPDDFEGPDDFPGATGARPAPSPTDLTMGPTEIRDPTLAALTDYLKSLEANNGGASSPSPLSDPASPQSQARNYVLSTLSRDDAAVLAALNSSGAKGNPRQGVQLRVGQLYGLAATYYATGGDDGGWDDGTNWLLRGGAADPCGWKGVTCGGGGSARRGRDLGTGTSTSTSTSTASTSTGRKDTGSIAADRRTHIDDIQRRAREDNGNDNENRRNLQVVPVDAITEIRLEDNGLDGKLDDNFGAYFPYLRTLALPSNSLSGPLPSSLLNGQMDNLQIIDLFDNDFTGSVADDMANMDQLLVLGLGDNDIDGQLPTSLPPKLQFLELSDNDFFGNIPGDAIGALSDLESLVLSDNARLVGPIPPTMFGSPNLLRLELDDCNLSGGIPPEIGQASALTYVNANGNALLTGPIPDALYSLVNLDTVLLYETAISGSISPAIGRLAKLRIAFLNDNNLAGPIPVEIGNCKALVELKLDDNNL